MCECLEHDDRTITLCEVCADVWRETEADRLAALSRHVPAPAEGEPTLTIDWPAIKADWQRRATVDSVVPIDEATWSEIAWTIGKHARIAPAPAEASEPSNTPMGRRLCPECNGSGTEACTTCSGQGSIPRLDGTSDAKDTRGFAEFWAAHSERRSSLWGCSRDEAAAIYRAGAARGKR